MEKLTPLSEKSVVGLLEGLSRRRTKKFTPFYSVVLNAPFCPVKQKLRKKQSEVSMVKIPQYKVIKWGKFFFFVFFEQSDRIVSTAAYHSQNNSSSVFPSSWQIAMHSLIVGL